MVNSKLRRHKVMEKVIKKLMAGNLPPRFKFKDTYTSIDVPQGYQQYLPTQQQVEAEFNEMITEEEELPTVDAAVDDVKVISSNLYVQSNTGNVGIGTASPGYMLDVTGSANVGALTATSLNVSGATNTVNLGLTHSLANRTTDTVFYSSDGNYIYKNTAAGLRTALDVPSASAAVFTGNVGVGTTNPGFSLDVRGTANVGTLTTTSLTIKDDPHPELNFNFTNSNWLQQQKLTAGTDAGASDQFGFSVSISSDGNTAIVGAWSDDDNGQSDSGSVYIFIRSGSSWTQQAKLTAGADAGDSDRFGYNVSISGDGSTAIVGAYYDDDNGQSNSGSAYIFVRSGSSWTQQQKLTAGADAGASDYFGWSVSISSDGNTVIVGAYYDDDNGQSNSGSAYIFVRSGSSWTQQQKLTAGADAGAGDYFGQSVSISSDGSTAIVGARRDDDNGQSNSGSAYIFVRSGSSWTQQQKLTAGTDAGASDYFGYNVSISGDGSTAIVGAYRDDDNGQSDSGSAYIFVRSGSSWTQQQKLTAGTDAGASDYFGWSVSISGDGSTAIVGAHQDDDNGLYSSGSAYIFNAERALHIPKDINVSGAAVFTGNVGIGTSEPVAKLHVNGGITKTQYNPGEVIETLHGRADGSSITVLSGTYTLTNTGLQDVGTGHTVINGSSISYKPPPGTTRVIYELQVYTRLKDGDVLMHFAGRLAGTQVSHSRHTFRSRDYEQQWVYNNMTITIGQVASDNLAAGQLASWTTNKTLDFTARDYNTSLEGYLHRTDHWDGGGTDITVTPVIKITAIA
jgi:phage shock protein PspC (stress-responsive transcriptional regulator)